MSQDAVAVVQQGYDAFKRGDINGLLDLMADNVVWETPVVEFEGRSFGGRTTGKAGVAAFFQSLGEREEVLAFETREFIAQGNKVVMVGHYRARVRATGRTAESPMVHIFTIENGKVSSFFEVFDTAAAVKAYQRAASA